MKDKKKAELIWSLTAGFRHRYLIAIATMTIAYLLLFSVPLAARFAIDLLESRNSGTIVEIPVVFSLIAEWSGESDPYFSDINLYLIMSGVATVGLTAVSGIFLYLRGRFTSQSAEGIARRLRNKVFTHLEHLPASFHDKADTGDLVQRCTSDVETLRLFLSNQIVEVSRAVIMLLLILPYLFWLDQRMAWLSLALLPVLFLFALIFFHKVKDLFTLVDESEAEMTTRLQENLTGVRVVKAFARQNHEINLFSEKNASFRDKNIKLTDSLGIYYGLSDLLCLGQIGLVLFAGAIWIQDGSLSVGTLYAFITYEGMIIWPIRHLGRVLMDCGKAIVSMGRLAEILYSPVESHHSWTPIKNLSGDIRFEHVTFGFTSDETILQDLSFHLEAGQTLAILGAPGSGKSTITQLLLRLYDYNQGSITIDNMELSELNRKFVRSQISIVSQDPFLYSTTIGLNLQIGHPLASTDEIISAARKAVVHDDIMSFPHGYDAMVGERGVTLSGGQRQRLALARALLKTPPILILDDALSAVDTETEKKILANLGHSTGKQTTIIVSHRLSSVIHADRILVLDKGKIIQSGTHNELAGINGTYQRLCKIQGNIDAQIKSDLILSSETSGRLSS